MAKRQAGATAKSKTKVRYRCGTCRLFSYDHDYKARNKQCHKCVHFGHFKSTCFTKKICKKPRYKNRRVKSEKQKLRQGYHRMKLFLERKQNLSHFPFNELDPVEFQAHVKPNIHFKTRNLQFD